jgi:hypothetical protein
VASKIDDLFSPQRLRKRWKQIEKSAKRPFGVEASEVEDQNALQLFDRLQNLINNQFQGDDVAALNFLLQELHELIVLKFPEAEKEPSAQKEKNDTGPAIYEVLDRIEDLVEAFEIAGRNR